MNQQDLSIVLHNHAYAFQVWTKINTKKEFAFRAFSNSTPRLWNAVPQTLNKCNSSTAFHKSLKAYLSSVECWTGALTAAPSLPPTPQPYLCFSSLSLSQIFPLDFLLLLCLWKCYCAMSMTCAGILSALQIYCCHHHYHHHYPSGTNSLLKELGWQRSERAFTQYPTTKTSSCLIPPRRNDPVPTVPGQHANDYTTVFFNRNQRRKNTFFFSSFAQVVLHLQLLCVAMLPAWLQPALQWQGEGQVAVPDIPDVRGAGGSGMRLWGGGGYPAHSVHQKGQWLGICLFSGLFPLFSVMCIWFGITTCVWCMCVCVSALDFQLQVHLCVCLCMCVCVSVCVHWTLPGACLCVCVCVCVCPLDSPAARNSVYHKPCSLCSANTPWGGSLHLLAAANQQGGQIA